MIPTQLGRFKRGNIVQIPEIFKQYQKIRHFPYEFRMTDCADE